MEPRNFFSKSGFLPVRPLWQAAINVLTYLFINFITNQKNSSSYVFKTEANLCLGLPQSTNRMGWSFIVYKKRKQNRTYPPCTSHDHYDRQHSNVILQMLFNHPRRLIGDCLQEEKANLQLSLVHMAQPLWRAAIDRTSWHPPTETERATNTSCFCLDAKESGLNANIIMWKLNQL